MFWVVLLIIGLAALYPTIINVWHAMSHDYLFDLTIKEYISLYLRFVICVPMVVVSICKLAKVI